MTFFLIRVVSYLLPILLNEEFICLCKYTNFFSPKYEYDKKKLHLIIIIISN